MKNNIFLTNKNMLKQSKRKSKKLRAKKSVGAKIKKTQVPEEPVANENVPIVFSWSTVDFKSKPFTEFSYIAAAVGAMAMIGWGIYNGNFVMIMTFVMMVVVIILVLNDKPRKVDVVISENGIDLNGEHYNYSAFRSYKISGEGKMPVLILKHRKSFSLIKTIYLEDEPVNDLESFLGIYLEREEDAVEA